MAYTPTVYTNDASSPDLDATNLNKSEQGIKDAHLMSVPVDCSSRVAEYTGDGIPLIPDNVAGRTYFQDDWATTDGWTVTNGTQAVANGQLSLTKTSTVTFNVFSEKSVSSSAKMFHARITAKQNIANIILYGMLSGTATTLASSGSIDAGRTVILTGYQSGSFDAVRILANTLTSAQVGELASIDWVYVGTGSYTSLVSDRAGNGNSLTLNAVTPVNGKYGKEMYFNGSTSFAQASSPGIGTTGTVAVRFKLNAIGLNNVIFDNRDGGGNNGYQLYVDTANRICFIMRGVSGQVQDITLSQTLDTGYHAISVHCTGSSVQFYLNGYLINTTTITITVGASSTNLKIGNRSSSFLNGIISNFRYDSRIWTADEARAWSLNPISIDSRV